MALRITRERVRTAVWTLVAVYAVLSVYAAVAGSDFAAFVTDLLFGLFVVGFGVLLLVRGNETRLLAAGGLLAVGGGLALLHAVVPVPGWLSDAPVVTGIGLYVYERWVRSGTDRPDPLDPENA